jgi:hypothetical protein
MHFPFRYVLNILCGSTNIHKCQGELYRELQMFSGTMLSHLATIFVHAHMLPQIMYWGKQRKKGEFRV